MTMKRSTQVHPTIVRVCSRSRRLHRPYGPREQIVVKKVREGRCGVCGVVTAVQCPSFVAGSTTSSFFTLIPRSEFAQPLVNTSVEGFSCQELVKTCTRSHPSILHRLSGCIRSVFRGAFHGLQDHTVNARMPQYPYAQQVRTSSPFPRTRWLREFCTLH